MRLKQHQVNVNVNVNQVTDENSCGSGGGFGGGSIGPFGGGSIGRDGLSFDAVQFRLLLAQKMAAGNNNGGGGGGGNSSSSFGSRSGGKYSAIFGHLGAYHTNPNSCSSPASSYQDEDGMMGGTLDLSMTSNKFPSGRSEGGDRTPSQDSNCTTDNEAEAEAEAEDFLHLDMDMELDLSQKTGGGRRTGSSRRKPQLVTSSSAPSGPASKTASRRKARQPKWVDPGLEFSPDEEEEDMDEMEDFRGRTSVSPTSDTRDGGSGGEEIINGVCVRVPKTGSPPSPQVKKKKMKLKGGGTCVSSEEEPEDGGGDWFEDSWTKPEPELATGH